MNWTTAIFGTVGGLLGAVIFAIGVGLFSPQADETALGLFGLGSAALTGTYIGVKRTEKPGA